jgi:polyisoprenyl-phosphate glycosyltransferase
VQKLRIVTPVHNDWDSLAMLLKDLDALAAALPVQIDVSAINDGSTQPVNIDAGDLATLSHLNTIEIIHLATNIGHQRAIAVGLCVAVEDADCDAILVMDADGEDSPGAIGTLIDCAKEGDYCVTARRGKRSENLSFRLSYLMYRLLFKLLTGHEIAFGNFSLLSLGYARRLVHVPELWNNLPAAILRSRLPIRAVRVDRARRYAGKSKMNFASLVAHGFSGISVYAETIFARFLILSVGLFFLSISAIIFVLTLRIFFPLYATPGWATTVSFGLSIILVQTISFTLSFILMLFHSRVQMPAIPIANYGIYVDHRQSFLRSKTSDVSPDMVNGLVDA